ncbi:hypothetical protein J7E96_32825 [Streptomyces sp. ISL-96]|nr:hypothetical protein [Streptomyces sp. ISL-96]MBT2493202.1 hypothetical protein [Streptomyces sp. ISL-96]
MGSLRADVVAAYNAANSKKLLTTVNWTPANTAGLQTSAKNLPPCRTY